MNKNNFKNNIPEGFAGPTSLPRSEKEAYSWQEANLSWWENNPMRYDWKEKIEFAEFTEGFYKEIDKRFFSNAEEYLPSREKPFDLLIDFKSLLKMDVLEIGVGNGSNAQLLAGNAKSFTGIDITDYAIKSVKKRFEIFNLPGRIIKMDAEKLDFPNNSFDFVWSWGVIHHSSNTEKILKEIQRVLRQNGKAIIMVYYKGWWNYYCMGFIKGIISGNLFRTKSLHKTVQFFTDGAIARYYTANDWRLLIKNLFKMEWINVFGPKADILLLPAGRIKKFICLIMPRILSRFLTHKLKMGSFLVFQMRKY
ncbi:class I SAM-dependent methyltransferase [Candidatus Wolfebacteria bacterium]|nr:class I SAM-dependent methyltransferase [Candidatus Wolfebacteria bacterium]